MNLVIDVYQKLWNEAQDDIERRVINLPLLVEVDADGWTVECYSQAEVMRLIKYAIGGDSKTKFKHIVDRLKRAGVIKTKPDEVTSAKTKQKYWFSYATGGGSAPPDSDRSGGSQPPSRETRGDSQPSSNYDPGAFDPHTYLFAYPLAGVLNPQIKANGGSQPPSVGVMRPHLARARANSDFSDDDTDISSTTDNHHQINHDTRGQRKQSIQLLKAVGVDKNNREMCLKVPHDHLKAIILNAQAGGVLHDLPDDAFSGGVANVPGFVVAICKDYEGREPLKNYLKALAMLPHPVVEPLITRLSREERSSAYIKILKTRYTDAGPDAEDAHVRRMIECQSASEIPDFTERAIRYLELIATPVDAQPVAAPEPSEEPADKAPSPEHAWGRTHAILSVGMLRGTLKSAKFLRLDGDTFVVQVDSVSTLNTLQFENVNRAKVESHLQRFWSASAKVKYTISAKTLYCRNCGQQVMFTDLLPRRCDHCGAGGSVLWCDTPPHVAPEALK